MEYVAIVTVIAVLQTFWFAFEVGAARGKYGVKAPAVTGAPEFERIYRVHQNTLEQLVLLLPSLWVFAYYVNAEVAAGLGGLFIIGRFIYRSAYRSDPKTRSAGFGTGALALVILAIGGAVGAVLNLVA